MDGRETLSAIRQLASGLPVTLASGYSEDEVLARVLEEQDFYDGSVRG